VDDARFQEANQLYAAGDYRAAAKMFLAAAGRGTEGNGAAYHMAGNCLLRLRRHTDAVTVYGHALKDELYEKRGAVRANLGTALVAEGEYALAVEEYRAAVEEPDYPTRYKAFQGMAAALREMGKTEEAASAYRQAALDGDNPDPGKALNNLGLCFMALGRPGDAIEAYKAALGFETYAGRGKALANLGIAFSALGQDHEAVKAFEKATQLHDHDLQPRALEAYERSRARLDGARPRREVVEGWQTGELAPTATGPEIESQAPEASFADVMDEASEDAAAPGAVSAGAGTDSSATGELFVDQVELDTAFFTRTDQEMREHDREARKAERVARREERTPWRTIATIVLAVVILVGVFAATYYSGLGFPTQHMTVAGLLDARAEGKSVDGYWVAVPAGDVEKEMAKLPPMKEYSVGAIERSPRTSRASVTITPQDGAPLDYQITLAREGVGWKITGVENDWRSTGGGS
jgi:tetratricopeptide (TPR) repeat protein